ncbi:2-cysteine peroxiredoxin [Lactarius sanguifluus]|nr:2-cysteine peroxiredoxin [Lactarius sanguifluus]
MSPTDGSFKEVSLADYLGQWVILMFYPLDSTFVCPTEILAFNDALLEFSRLDTTVLGTPSLALNTAQSRMDSLITPRSAGGLGPDLRIPLLADRNMRIARDYGCLIEDKGITFRTSYLVDPKGILRQITMNDPPIGRSVDEALRLVQAFQMRTARCVPRTGRRSKTIRADPLAKLDYFAATTDGAHENGKTNGTKRARMDTE